MSRSRTAAAILAAACASAAATPAAVAQQRGARATPKPFFDSRDDERRAVERRGDESLRPLEEATRRARRALDAAVRLDVDPLTGTPRALSRADRPLGPPEAGDAAAVARRFLERRRTLLALDGSDVDALRVEDRVRIPGGGERVRFRQYAGPIPSFDGGLDVVVGPGGRVQSLTGAAQPDLAVAATHPQLTAAEALRRLMDDVGVSDPAEVASGPTGARRATTFASGDTAALVAFGEGTSARLAWQVDLRASVREHYTAILDARTGALLYRANSVKTAANDASVWEQHPGAPRGGTAVTRDLSPYLNAGATDLSGPFAQVWSDVDDDDVRENGELTGRSGAGSFVHPFTDFTAFNAGCSASARCSWSLDDDPRSWETNRPQSAVQTFYLVNRFRDRLVAPPISFSAADGSFEGADRVLVNAHDGAATFRDGGPDDEHMNNAFMDTPRDGLPPTMAMFLFSSFGGSPFRDVNGGDDAAIVYHEYTHGLSSRLVTTASGDQALNKPQAGAMGEGWSDFYAKDFLVEQFPADDTAAPGEVDMGAYTDAVAHSIRSEALDCPVGAPSLACPGPDPSIGSAGSGGYTYGDFGRIFGTPEVHADGEIWAQTLWDLRGALGSAVTRAIVTQGMRLSPAEPSFLQMRDAIVLGDRSLFPDGDHSGAIWQVYAQRGMGWNASTNNVTQTTVTAGSKRPPTASLTVTPAGPAPGATVTLDASGSVDPDGTVAPSYAWDFDGNDVVDSTTTTPSTTTSYPAAGIFTARVTVRDDENQVDSASRVVRVAVPPTATPIATASPAATATPAPPQAPAPGSTALLAPRITLAASGTRGRIRVTVRCDSACAGTARLTVSRKLARRLALGGSRQVGRLRLRLTAAGAKRFSVRLSRAARRTMRLAGVPRLSVLLSASVTDAERQRAASRRAVRVRR